MFRQTFLMSMTTAARLATNVILFVILARVWGPARFGVFVYPMTIATLGTMLVDYGFGLQVVRDISRDVASVEGVLRRAVGAKVLLTALLIVGAIFTTPFLSLPAGSLSVWGVLLAASIINSFVVFFSLPLRAVGYFEDETRIAAWSSAILFGSVVLVLSFGGGPLAVSWCFLVTRVFALAQCLFAFRRRGLPRPSIGSVSESVRALVDGLPFGIHIAFGTLYFQLDTVFVQHFLGTEGTGLYQAGIRVLMAGLVLPDVLTNVYLPAMARVGTSRDALSELGERMTRHLLTFGVASFAVLTFGSSVLVSIAYGAKYDGIGPILPLFGLVLALRCAGASYGLLLTVSDRQTVRTIAVTFALVANVALNWLLVPAHRLYGAAIAAILTQVLLVGIYFVFADSAIRGKMFNRRSQILLAMGASLAAAMWFTDPSSSNKAVAVGTSLVAAILTVFVGIPRREWRFLTERLSRTTTVGATVSS